MTEQVKKITVPDIGGAENVDVIEVLVKPGDTIRAEDSLITLEGDKATMEVPSPSAGTVVSVAIKTGDKVSAGSLILELKLTEDDKDKIPRPLEKEGKKDFPAPPLEKAAKEEEAEATVAQKSPLVGEILAGPAARRLAREVGIDLAAIIGSGEKGRVTKEDVQNTIKQRMSSGGGATGNLSVTPLPAIDFSKFGEVVTQPLSKIQKISGTALHRNWVTIPHVTQFDEVDITEMEVFRQQQKAHAEQQGIKLTPLVFIMKAVVAALRKFEHFNASLAANGEQIILKKYFHLGVAVDTPNGLVVPVVRNVDQKSLFELAKELAFISKKVRETGLSLADMQGGCFSISSLGGIGGTAFTPIINAPEVAILGVSKSVQKPVYQTDGQLVPRLMLPLSLSYDHRVIDGADAARFIVYINQCLADIRTLLL